MNNKKIGIITFHNSYNCGSMLETYAMQEALKKRSNDVKIINFSTEGQKELYSATFKNNSIKNILKNILIFPYRKKLLLNNKKYEKFKNEYFDLTKEYNNNSQLDDESFDIVVSGSDQIWNITIPDYDDAYFLNWVKKSKKIAYAPSFGAKKLDEYTTNVDKFVTYIKNYDSISIRENNGKKWLKELTNIDVPVLIDPTLLLDASDYDTIMANDITNITYKYIFLYCPSFDVSICKYVKKIAKKYNLKVITWSTKSYATKLIKRFGFELAQYENPASYLYYIKNAELVMTTSFHGTIFSTIYRKKFITIKNGGMYGNDDRVLTLLESLDLLERLLPYKYDNSFNYLSEVNYQKYEERLKILKEKANVFLDNNIN